jgi:hypothetical protein
MRSTDVADFLTCFQLSMSRLREESLLRARRSTGSGQGDEQVDVGMPPSPGVTVGAQDNADDVEGGFWRRGAYARSHRSIRECRMADDERNLAQGRPDLRIHAVFAPGQVTYSVLASEAVSPLSDSTGQHGMAAANRIGLTPLRDHAIDHSP